MLQPHSTPIILEFNLLQRETDCYKFWLHSYLINKSIMLVVIQFSPLLIAMSIEINLHICAFKFKHELNSINVA